LREFPPSVPPFVKHLTVWLLLGTVLFLAVKAWQAHQRRPQFHAAAGVVELRRGADGHFRWPGRLNGVAVDFLVDTGATRTALPQALARRAGLQAEGSTRSQTAGGEVRGWVARADVALDGGVRAQRLTVTVLPDLAAPLLGMDVLSKMRFSQRDGVLRFEPGGG
jgi:aspartyl protease family protein